MIDSLEIDYKKIKSLVSRETLKELETFRKLIIMRNNDINLISSTTIGASKDRHIVDSAQIIDFSVLVLIKFIYLFFDIMDIP